MVRETVTLFLFCLHLLRYRCAGCARTPKITYCCKCLDWYDCHLPVAQIMRTFFFMTSVSLVTDAHRKVILPRSVTPF